MKTGKVAEQRRDALSLTARIINFYRCYNREDWPRCYEYVDPMLRDGERVGQGDYSRSLEAFFGVYGPIQEAKILRLSIHDGAQSKNDPRDFAYVVVSWKDKNNNFHHFRERWIKDQGKWFTRVVGLVPGRPETP